VSGFRKNPAPVGFQSRTMIKDSCLRMAKNMKVTILQSSDIAAALILGASKHRVKGANRKI
jgi:hypothetical protein